MTRVLGAEFLKLKRSMMPLWTSLAVLVYAALNLAILPAVTSPKTLEKIASVGGVFAEAVTAGLYRPNWTNFLHFGAQGIAGSWGVLTFGLVAAYLFGREFKEGTATTMLTLPVRREYVVLAKLAVLAVWVFGLTLLSVVLQMGVVALLGVSGFAWMHVVRSLTDGLTVSLLLYLTLPVVAWFAMLGKGYLRPMLFSLAMMMVGNALVGTSWSRWFPWNMPLHLVGASWYPIPPSGLVPGSWAVAVGVFLAGLAALVWQIDHTDNAR